MVDIVNQNDKTICLNMIVKDEAHIIEATLNNILQNIQIDYWVISDTGSTDDTMAIIRKFFKERNIDGELFQDGWKDFGTNRSKALEHAYNKSDYIFIFDADDLIHGQIALPIHFDKDMYQLPFENPTSFYRSVLISNRMRWKYNGVLHEMLANIDPIKSEEFLLGNFYIQGRTLGNRSKNPNKYIDDAVILANAYQNETVDIWLKNRYSYYCAQSYQDAGKIEKAIEWYENTLILEYSPQYKYCACIRIGDCYTQLKQYDEAIEYWGKAYDYDQERVEGVVKIMEYYYNKEIHFMVSALYNKFKHITIGKAKDKIFLDHSKYHDLHYFGSISGCYCNEHKSAYEACKYLLLNNRPNTENTIYNIQFYITQFKEDTNKQLLVQFFINYIQDKSNTFKQREHIWKLMKGILKEEYSSEYSKLEEIILSFKKKTIDKNNRYASSNKILIYTGWITNLWNDSHLEEKALGGSEKAVAYLTREFPKHYDIIVSGYVEDGAFGNVTYVHQNKLQSILDRTEFHTIIISRNICFLNNFNNIKCFQLVLSLHDNNILNNGLSAEPVLEMYKNKIDKVVTLTNWHKSNITSLYPIINPNKIEIINNGIDVLSFNANKNSNKTTNKFIWSSRSERGLHIVLNLWGNILEKIPDATLDICCYGDFPKDDEDEKMLEIINSYDSIIHHGKLNSIQLYDLMSKSEYWLYTSTFPETSCITAMEMLMSEVICIYYPLAGLNDTVGDYGIPVKHGEELEPILTLSNEKKKLLRENGKKYAMTCSWKNRAEQWTNMLLIGENNKLATEYHNNYVLNFLKNTHIRYNIPNKHITFLEKLSKEFNPDNMIIYNIGSGVLHWTQNASNLWKNSIIYPFDGMSEMKLFYDEYNTQNNTNYEYNIGVLCDEDYKKINFYQNDELSGGNSYYKEIGHKDSHIIFTKNHIKHKIGMKLETVVKNKNIPMPDLIKIDVQGAELDILKGSMNVINHAKFLIVELQHTQYNEGAPMCNTTCEFLIENGWQVYAEKFCNNGPDADWCFINTNK